MFEIFSTPYADSKQLPLASGPGPILIIITSYLLVVFKAGRKFMEHREPYNLRGVLKYYNMVQICYNMMMLLSPYKLSCMTVLPQDHPLKDWERSISYAYYINKIVDLLDSVFCVLRKKYAQITFLHVFHHVLMPTAGYVIIRFQGYGGHLFLLCSFNVIVHVFMYGYYYSAIGGKTVRWKRYLTLLQMMQFVLMFGHCAFTATQPECKASQGTLFLVSCSAAVMFVMFANFYVQCYMGQKEKNN
ncbi:elongation of very long chain fatty acids protein F isoform X2 [Drosophila elegans]|uniref:elongation of very long chain fatty acids protein F isoform X2 n=1 Tax=Drosophila elegans TaxID=30023 RepID=UPI0007E7A719|nr:elongation of very long chain fatty acids protein F isoform X2 [Drosophila elegans]